MTWFLYLPSGLSQQFFFDGGKSHAPSFAPAGEHTPCWRYSPMPTRMTSDKIWAYSEPA